MIPLYLVTGSIQYALANRSLDVPQVGDIVLCKREPNSPVEYSLYESSEDYSRNSKTWLLKLLSCPVRFQDPSEIPERAVKRMKCMILLVWEPGVGFKEAPGGGVLEPDVQPTTSIGEHTSGQGSNWPGGDCIALAFTQPCSPLGPTFLRVDFWKQDYFEKEYAKLVVLSVVDCSSPGNGEIRTVSIWRRSNDTWISTGSVSGPRILSVVPSVKAVLV